MGPELQREQNLTTLAHPVDQGQVLELPSINRKVGAAGLPGGAAPTHTLMLKNKPTTGLLQCQCFGHVKADRTAARHSQEANRTIFKAYEGLCDDRGQWRS